MDGKGVEISVVKRIPQGEGSIEYIAGFDAWHRGEKPQGFRISLGRENPDLLQRLLSETIMNNLPSDVPVVMNIYGEGSKIGHDRYKGSQFLNFSAPERTAITQAMLNYEDRVDQEIITKERAA